MAWSSISANELSLLIDESFNAMPEPLRAAFEKFRVIPRLENCKRSDLKMIEQVFVVAQAGGRAIIYDDVEDEFGIAKIPMETGDAFGDWELVGDLPAALRQLH